MSVPDAVSFPDDQPTGWVPTIDPVITRDVAARTSGTAAGHPDGPSAPPEPVPDPPGGGLETSYAVAWDDPPDPADLARPVDAAGRVPPVWGERRPIIPAALRPGNLRATVRYQVGRAAHVSAYHAVRLPWYVLLVGWAAALGAARVARAEVLWAWVAEQDGLRRAAVDASDGALWLRIQRETTVARRRRVFLLVGQLVAVGLLVALLPGMPSIVQIAVGGGVVVGLVRVGRTPGRPLIAPAMVTPRFRRLTGDVVLRAYYAARLGDPVKPGQQVTFGTPMARDGAGSRVVVDLPYGRGLAEAVRAKDAIASGLDVSAAQVFISRDPSSQRRHVLWVADRDPLAIPAGRSPLLRCRPTDIWTPAPFGLDERGRRITVEVMFQSVLVGAQPRQGKTFTLRSLGLFGALDPYAHLYVFDASGKPDWRGFGLIADRCGFGLSPTRDGDPIDTLLATLRELKTDVQDRYLRLSELPAAICPEGKLTRSIARNPAYRMPVRILILDEFQEYFNTGDTVADKEIAELLVYLVRVAPAAGLMLFDATQRPSGIGSGGEVARRFTDFRDNHLIRFSLRTGSYQVSDLILGAGAYTEGLDSSTLLPQYKGAGILRGASDQSPTVRTYLADGQDADKILRVGRALREQAGTLSGHAAGQDIPRENRDVLADVAGIFDTDPGLHWADIAARLAARLPEHYADVTGDTISAQLRDLGVASVNVKRDGRVAKGARVDAVTAARDLPRAGSAGPSAG